MFCTKCGKKNEGGVKFCTSCGKAFVQANAALPSLPDLPPPPVIAAKPPVQKSGTSRHLRAVVAVLAAVIIGASMMGWIRIDISVWDLSREILEDVLNPRDLAEVRNAINRIVPGGFQQSHTLYDLGNFGNAINILLDIVENEGANLGMSPAVVSNFAADMGPIRAAADAAGLARLIPVVIIALMAAFLYLLLAESKYAAAMGQIAAGIAFVISLGVIIIMRIANTLITNAIGAAILVNASPWVFVVTLASCAALIILIVARKSINLQK